MTEARDTQPRRTGVGVYALLSIAIIVGLLWVRSAYGYLLFHALVELFAISIAAGTFMITWNLRRRFDSGYLVVLGISFFFAASVDVLHLLAYQGMGVFPDTDANLATQLWLIARYLQAAGLIAAPFFSRRRVSAAAVFWVFAAATAALLASVFVFELFPAAFVEGSGLTTFKVASEYVVSVAMVLGLLGLWRSRQAFTPQVRRLLSAMILMAIAAELAFTLYQDPYGAWNFIGHLLKVAVFMLLYRAIAETALVRPLDLLFRDLQRTAEDLAESEARLRATFEQSAIGMADISLEGRWLKVNRRLAEIAGYPFEELLRLRPEDITHPDDLPAERALLKRLIEGNITEYHFEKRYIRPDKTHVWVAVSRTLMRGPDGSPRYFVATVEDISERVRREDGLRRSRDLTQSLKSIDLAINALTDVEDIVRVAADSGCEALGAESAAVLLHDGGRWRPAHLYHYPASDIPDHAPSGTPVPVADEDGAPLVIEDTRAHERMQPDTMEALGIRALLTVPLRFRDEQLGVIYFNYHRGPHRFSDADVQFARDLSSSVSLAIENARLYAAQRMIADTLQSALLAMPVDLPGLELAHIYRSATELARIGGDFYDVFEVGDQVIAFVLGDVSGKGIEAATLTAMAKSTLRAYAYEDPRPEHVLAAANRAITTQVGDSRFITAVYGTIHVPTGSLAMASAGHPEPVLCRADRCAGPGLTSAPPLGVLPDTLFEPYTTTLQVGDLLVVFSDGLVEARNEHGFLGEHTVRETVQAHVAEPAAAVAAALLSAVEDHSPGRIEDDVAIVVLRYSGPLDDTHADARER